MNREHRKRKRTQARYATLNGGGSYQPDYSSHYGEHAPLHSNFSVPQEQAKSIRSFVAMLISASIIIVVLCVLIRGGMEKTRLSLPHPRIVLKDAQAKKHAVTFQPNTTFKAPVVISAFSNSFWVTDPEDKGTKRRKRHYIDAWQTYPTMIERGDYTLEFVSSDQPDAKHGPTWTIHLE